MKYGITIKHSPNHNGQMVLELTSQPRKIIIFSSVTPFETKDFSKLNVDNLLDWSKQVIQENRKNNDS